MRFRLSDLAAPILMVALAAPCFADSHTAAVYGRIVDSDGAAVVGATIVVRAEVSGAERHAESGGDGTFRIDNLAHGNYRVSATAPGFSTDSRTIEIGDAPANVDFALMPGTIS